MANFLAYFDLLGYKKFIENNTPEHLDYRTNHFARNIERALSLDHPTLQANHPGVFISDISHSTLSCLTFSDTVILWTNTNTLQDFDEILKVAHKYNQFNVTMDFPSRGCIVYGDIWYKPFESNNQRGGQYMLNMIYGKALVEAYEKAEAMSWAGCVLDNSAIEYAKSLGNIDDLLSEYTMIYDIPYKTKDGEVKQQGYALRLYNYSLLITEHIEKSIASAFTHDQKGNIEGRTKIIFDNTIEFLKAHQIVFPFYYHTSTNEETEVFGRLEVDYTHTIIKKNQNGNNINYTEEITKFDPDKSERNFLDSKQITKEIFEDHLTKVER